MSYIKWLTYQADKEVGDRQAAQKDERWRMKFLGFSNCKNNKKVSQTRHQRE